MDDTQRQTDHPPAPRLSVVVPTYGRPERIRTLVGRLREQSLPPDQFEVVVVDDGSPEPIAIDPAGCAFALQVLRQPNAGPATARNLGVAHARAPLILFLNDDAVPALDLLALHLEAHAAGGRIAVMGAFPFTARSLEEPFTRLLAETSLLFDFSRLRHGELHDWTFFWTCNISLARALLDEVGGFDGQTFRDAIVEDVELGYRLERVGVRTLYRADAVCQHEHPLTVEDYFRRSLKLGVNLAKMWRKHQDMRILWQPPELPLRDYLRLAQLNAELLLPRVEPFLAVARRWSDEARGRPGPPADAARMAQLVQKFAGGPVLRGVIQELMGHDVQALLERGPREGLLTSIVICSHNALAKTQACLASIRRNADPDFPSELILVDNGSTDGSVEWLAAQPDVRLLRNTENLGAPAARNQALSVVRGDYVAILDNDIVVTRGWLRRLHHHAEVDPRAGCIGATADRASHGQQVDFDGPYDVASIERFAAAQAEQNDRVPRAALTLASFCILVRRDLVDRIGGFDERFSPWGFEDDDFTLRCHLAGHSGRVAMDVFVHHDTYTGPKAERHQRLLLQNWGRFAEKWGFGGAAYNDASGLAAALQRSWTDAELRVPLRPPPPETAAGPAPATVPGAAAAPAPRASIVVVAQGAWDETLACLTALARDCQAIPHQLIVVDDGTTDETALALTRLPGLLSIRSDARRGFAAAANAGASQATAPFVAFLHGDAEPAAGWLERLLALGEGDPTVAAVACRLVEPGGTIEGDGIAFRYGDPYPLTPFPIDAGAPATPSGDVTEVPAIAFAAALVRREALLAAGGFDEALSGPAAEIDLALRLGAAGGLVLAAHGAVARHQGTCPCEIPDADATHLTRAWLGRVPMIDPREGPPAAPPRAGRPALSVVVPAGDALRTIAPCLEGLLRNLGPADELLVADAGGADGTREYAELLASEQDGRMRVLPAAPGGPAALRAGLAAATHPIALLLHPGLGAPDGFVDGVTQLLAAQGGDVVIALPTGGGVCAAGPLETLRRLSEASADAFFAPDLAPIGDAALATGTRVASVT